MRMRRIAALAGIIIFPLLLGLSFTIGLHARYVDGWSLFWIIPTVVILGPPTGFVLGWLAVAIMQALRDERQTRVIPKSDNQELI